MVCMVCVAYGLYGMLEFMLCCENLLLLNTVAIWIDGRLWSEQYEYLVHLVHMNRLSAYKEFCGVHSWQRDWHKM